MNKKMNLADAVSLIHDGDAILAGGFYGNGTPERIVDELLRQGQKDLHIYNNDGNTAQKGVGRLVAAGRAARFVCTWCGRLPEAARLADEGKMEFEVCPQGTFAERIRAGGYGLGGVLTRTGKGTIVEEQAEKVTLGGEEWLYYPPIRGKVSIIEADRADEYGNLRFHLTQRGFATAMCFASDLVIVQVNNPIEPVGSIAPEDIHVPGVVVDVLIPPEEGQA